MIEPTWTPTPPTEPGYYWQFGVFGPYIDWYEAGYEAGPVYGDLWWPVRIVPPPMPEEE